MLLILCAKFHDKYMGCHIIRHKIIAKMLNNKHSHKEINMCLLHFGLNLYLIIMYS